MKSRPASFCLPSIHDWEINCRASSEKEGDCCDPVREIDLPSAWQASGHLHQLFGSDILEVRVVHQGHADLASDRRKNGEAVHSFLLTKGSKIKGKTLGNYQNPIRHSTIHRENQDRPTRLKLTVRYRSKL